MKSKLIINLLISLFLIQKSIQAYIIPFDLPINDFNMTVSNQLSRNEFRTSTFTTDNVTVSKLIYKATYNGSNRIIDPKQQSSFHTVWNDSIDLIVTYEAIVHRTQVTKKTYNGTTTLKIYVNYTKKLVPGNDATQITGLQVHIDKNSFVMTYTDSPSSNDKSKLDEINNGVVSGKKNTTILTLLQNQQFTKEMILACFKDNLVNQKISPTYDSNYTYWFNNVKAEFDMTTAGIQPLQHGIAHSLKAKIKNYDSKPILQLPSAPYIEGYHTLFSLDFIDYFYQFNLEKNPDWVTFKINRNTYHTRVFNFRLIDLQFLFEKISQKYAEFYLNDISIICKKKAYGKWTIKQESNTLGVQTVWSCQGYLEGPTPSALILDFEAQMTYVNEIRLSSNMLVVYITESKLNLLTFKPIDESTLQEPELADFFANEIVEYLRGYTVGSNFKVKDSSQKIALKEGVGIYVG